MGYAVMVLIGIRLLWGLTFARGHARLRALIPSREDFRHQADALRERTPPTRAITAAASWRSGHSGCWYSPPQGPAGSRTPRPASIWGRTTGMSGAPGHCRA
jgi:hypothetical protein